MKKTTLFFMFCMIMTFSLYAQTLNQNAMWPNAIWTVTGIYNKTGDLLVQVYERKQEKFYYFRIPYDSYCNIPKSSNIEIPFELNGSPRRHNKKQNNPWDYECDSFLDMCYDEHYNDLAPKSIPRRTKFSTLFDL